MKNLISIIEGVKGCQFGTIQYISEGGIPKKVLGGAVVTKLVTAQMQIGYSYENAVNNRLEKQGNEGNFVAESLPWGSWLIPNKIITHKDTLYLRYYDYKGASKESVWFVNGRVATAHEMELIVTYLRSKDTTSKKQAEHGLTENQVKPKVVKMHNIVLLSVGGHTYRNNNNNPFEFKVVG